MAVMKKEDVQVVDNSQLLMEEIAKLRQEMASIKGAGEKPVGTNKDKYKGPYFYGYKMWNNMVVQDYQSKKKDPLKGFTYKGRNGEIEQNQVLELKLFDPENPEKGITTDVMVDDFLTNCRLSNKFEVEKIVNAKSLMGTKRVVFDEDTRRERVEDVYDDYYYFNIQGHSVPVASRTIN